MRRPIVAMTFGFMALLVLAAPVSAGRRWCAKDPIVALNGEAVQVWVAIPEELESAVTGPTTVTFAIPAGVATDVVFLDAGFNDLGESVSFTRLRPRTVTTVDPDGTIVKTKIVPEVAADGSFPIEVTTRFPVDREVMRSYGVRGSRIPLRITVVTNGELVVGEDGLPQVINGETFEVTGENWGTTVLARVAPGD